LEQIAIISHKLREMRGKPSERKIAEKTSDEIKGAFAIEIVAVYGAASLMSRPSQASI
jgi:hypothetical protein